MKKAFLAIGLLGVITVGCLKNDTEDYKPCTPKAVEAELPAMRKFAADSSINTAQDASGILYQIVSEGTGPAIATGSTVVARYVGRFMNGKGFDSSYLREGGVASFRLDRVIPGWTIGIPKIRKGGKIKLIIPSSLAYGCADVVDPYTGKVVMPADQPLYFYVEVMDM